MIITNLHLLKALVAIAERPLARADDLSFDDALEEINSMISLARRTVEHTNYNMLGDDFTPEVTIDGSPPAADEITRR